MVNCNCSFLVKTLLCWKDDAYPVFYMLIFLLIDFFPRKSRNFGDYGCKRKLTLKISSQYSSCFAAISKITTQSKI